MPWRSGRSALCRGAAAGSEDVLRYVLRADPASGINGTVVIGDIDHER